MKKILVIVALLFSVTLVNAASVWSTNILAGANNYMTNAFTLLSGRANVSQVTLYTTVSSGATVKLVDTAEWGAPTYGYFYTNAAFVTRSGYATNITNYYIGSNGYTNTNVFTGYYTYNVTNAAGTTNYTLPALGTFVVQPNIATTVPVDLIFSKGVSALVSTNVSIILYYNQ